MVLLWVVDDVFGSLLLVAEDAALAVVTREVDVDHLGVVPNTNLRTEKFIESFRLMNAIHVA